MLIIITCKPFDRGTANHLSFAVVRIAEKIPAEDASFTEELRQEYIQEFQIQLRYNRFLRWMQELLYRSRLEDYMPSSQPVETNDGTPSKRAEEEPNILTD